MADIPVTDVTSRGWPTAREQGLPDRRTLVLQMKNLCPESSPYLSPKCGVREHSATGGRAVFAVKPVGKGETVAIWGGRHVRGAELDGLPPEIRAHTVQVDEDLYLASLTPDEPPDFINHSCEPNAGLNGEIKIVALRDIVPGEEVTIDYAMCDGTPYDEFDCACGSALCRGRVTGEDWRDPELWRRYAGHFSPYLQRRIGALRRRIRAGAPLKETV